MSHDTITIMSISPVTMESKVIPSSEILDKESTNFNDIGNLMQEKIFGLLTPDDLQVIRTVCRDWLFLINNKFGIKAVIDNRNSELVRSSPYIVDVQLVNLTRPISPEGISFALRLKHLFIKGIVVSYNLLPLLTSCVYLQSLTLDEPTFDLPTNIVRSLTPKNLQLKECLTVEFICWTFSESLNTVVSLLTLIQFGNLKAVTLRSVHPPMLPLGLLFAKAPRPIPEHLSPIMGLILQNLSSLEVLSVGTLMAQSRFKCMTGSGIEEGSVLQLEELHLQNLYMSWTPILEAQSHLNVLVIGHCQAVQWAEIRNCITRCENLLRKVELQGRTFGVPWECDIFSSCVNLEVLHLNLSLSPKRLLNTLPLTITELALDGPIEITELENLQLLTNLQNLYLNSLGLNLLILFPGNPEDVEENQDTIRLHHFVDLILSITSLEIFSVKDCSQDALDWTGINEWCRKIASDLPTITFSDHFYDVHGQHIQHGLTLKIPRHFSRQELKIRSNFDEGVGRGGLQPLPRQGFIGNVLRIFGL